MQDIINNTVKRTEDKKTIQNYNLQMYPGTFC